MQLKYLRLSLAVSRSCPIPMLYHQTGTLMMSNRILQRKLLILHHVATLPVSTLARDFYDTQKENNISWFGEGAGRTFG